jgi:hypothetical protein
VVSFPQVSPLKPCIRLFEEKKNSTARSPVRQSFVQWHRIRVGSQDGTCLMSHFWRLDFLENLWTAAVATRITCWLSAVIPYVAAVSVTYLLLG